MMRALDPWLSPFVRNEAGAALDPERRLMVIAAIDCLNVDVQAGVSAPVIQYFEAFALGPAVDGTLNVEVTACLGSGCRTGDGRGTLDTVVRDVVRLVTPGTLTEESLLEARRHNYLAAFAEVRDGHALAWVDISTGAFHVMPLTLSRLGPELARLSPSELILSLIHI